MRPELDAAIAAAREAGRILLSHYGAAREIRDKGSDPDRRLPGAPGGARCDPVTQADLEVDACLRELLTAACPDCGWLSEESVDSPERPGKRRLWIVDPVDGTMEFLDQIGEFGTSIALVEDGDPVVAVIFNPVSGELFSAVRGGGCFLNGKRVFCSPAVRLDRATLIVSRSETGRGEIDPLRPHLGKVRPVGSVAYKLALVAAGVGDLNVSVKPKNEWDVCAGDLLVREAGGRMLDLHGQVRRYNQPSTLIEPGLVAGNKPLTAQMLELLDRLREGNA